MAEIVPTDATALAKSDNDATLAEAKAKDDMRAVSFLQLFRFATGSEVFFSILGVVAALTAGATQPLLMVLFGDLTEATSSDTAIMDILTPLVFSMLYVATGAAVTFLVAYWSLPYAAATIAHNIRSAYFRSVLRSELSEFDKKMSGAIVIDINEKVHNIEKALSIKMAELMSASAQFFLGMVFAFYYCWQLTLVVMALLPLMVFATSCMYKSGFGQEQMLGKQAYEYAANLANEAVSAMRTVSSFSGEVAMSKRYNSKLGASQKAATKAGWKMAFGSSLVDFAFFAMMGAGLFFGGYFALDSRKVALEKYPAPYDLHWEHFDKTNFTNPYYMNHMASELGDFCRFPTNNSLAYIQCMCNIDWSAIKGDTAFASPNCGCQYRGDDFIKGVTRPPCQSVGSILTAFWCILIGGFSLGMIGPALEAIVKGRRSAFHLYAAIDRIPTIDTGTGNDDDDSAAPKLPKIQIQGNITFNHVDFSYVGIDGNERPVFNDLSIDIKAGETVAFVGESGSGKSTIGKLVSRFYDPKKGTILIDGQDLTNVDVNSLRSQIGIVSQEPLLFDTTIRTNISYGVADYENVTDEAIMAAAKAANAHSFISSKQFPQGYSTSVGSRGGKLSGGQKQRIAIARAILRNPKILILDEATSALDTESERIVQTALDELLQGDDTRTTIVIAHRLSTVRKADRIIVLGEGEDGMGGGTKIVEEGTHDALMALKGVYFGLVGAQGETSQDEANTASSTTTAIKKDNTETKLSTESSPTGKSLFIDNNSSNSTNPMATETKNNEGQNTNDMKKNTDTADDGDEKKEDNDLYPVPTSRLWAYASDHKIAVVCGVVSASVNGCVFPGMGFYFGEMLNAFTIWDDEDARAKFLLLFIYFLVLGTIALLSRAGQVGFFTVSGEAITKGVRQDLFKAMLRQNIEWFDHPTNSVGALMTMLGMDASTVQNMTGQSLGSIINSCVCALLGLYIAFTVSWRLSLALLGALPLLGAAEGAQQTLMISGEKNIGKALNASAEIVNESVKSAKEIQAFGLQSVVHKYYTDLLLVPTQARKKTAFASGVTMGFVQFVTFSFYAGAFYYGGWLVEHKYVDFDGFMKALFVLAFMASGAGQAATFAGNVTKSKISTSTIFQLIDRVPPIDTQPWDPVTGENRVPKVENTIAKEHFKGKIVLENIYFAYPTRADADVFTGMSLEIEAGQSVALIGTSGSGKSTIIQLLERFYDPLRRVRTTSKDGKDGKDGKASTTPAIDIVTEDAADAANDTTASASTHGRILIDGRDMKHLDLKWLRQNVGLVGQEPRLFQGTISENIAMGKTTSEATQAEIESAAKAANAHDFIMKIGGYDVDVGPGGSKLSGGQKQRVAIARAIIKNPKILLLDEATSALDNESEKIVQASLDTLLADKTQTRTTVIIAHRLSTIRNCDKIFVLDRDWNDDNATAGSIVAESGTHDELMALGGKYKALRNAFDGDADGSQEK